MLIRNRVRGRGRGRGRGSRIMVRAMVRVRVKVELEYLCCRVLLGCGDAVVVLFFTSQFEGDGHTW